MIVPEFDVDEMIRKISAYFETPEGEALKKKIAIAVEKLIKDLAEQEKVSDEVLHRRITI
jgi:hypothetical protein